MNKEKTKEVVSSIGKFLLALAAFVLALLGCAAMLGIFIGVYAGLGYLTRLVFLEFGIDKPTWVFAVVWFLISALSSCFKNGKHED